MRGKWIYVPPAKPQWSRDQLLICPVGGTTEFGKVPEIVVRGGPTFPTGKILLPYGEHFGANRGFGFQHIWREHFHQILNHDDAIEAVRQRIAGILRPETPLHYEAGERMTAHRLSVGLAILELRPGTGETPPTYSVVTGGWAPRNTKGPVIGALVSLD